MVGTGKAVVTGAVVLICGVAPLLIGAIGAAAVVGTVAVDEPDKAWAMPKGSVLPAWLLGLMRLSRMLSQNQRLRLMVWCERVRVGYRFMGLLLISVVTNNGGEEMNDASQYQYE